ncbi:hypothetical protein DOY81_003086, partial [Sarcophaga bullata]
MVLFRKSSSCDLIMSSSPCSSFMSLIFILAVVSIILSCISQAVFYCLFVYTCMLPTIQQQICEFFIIEQQQNTCGGLSQLLLSTQLA